MTLGMTADGTVTFAKRSFPLKELRDELPEVVSDCSDLVFDLEATRRENTYLRKLVEQANREDAAHDDDDDYCEGEASGSD